MMKLVNRTLLAVMLASVWITTALADSCGEEGEKPCEVCVKKTDTSSHWSQELLQGFLCLVGSWETRLMCDEGLRSVEGVCVLHAPGGVQAAVRTAFFTIGSDPNEQAFSTMEFFSPWDQFKAGRTNTYGQASVPISKSGLELGMVEIGLRFRGHNPALPGKDISLRVERADGYFVEAFFRLEIEPGERTPLKIGSVSVENSTLKKSDLLTIWNKLQLSRDNFAEFYNGTFERDTVVVLTPAGSGGGALYNIQKNIINLEAIDGVIDSVVNGDALLHEYGHKIFYDLVGPGRAPMTQCSVHSPNRPTSERCAFAEGWANYFAASVNISGKVRTPGSYIDYYSRRFESGYSTVEGVVTRQLLDMRRSISQKAMFAALETLRGTVTTGPENLTMDKFVAALEKDSNFNQCQDVRGVMSKSLGGGVPIVQRRFLSNDEQAKHRTKTTKLKERINRIPCDRDGL